MVVIVASTAGALLFAGAVYVLVGLTNARQSLRLVCPVLAACVVLLWGDAAMSTMADIATLATSLLVLLVPPRWLAALALTGAIFAAAFVFDSISTWLQERGGARRGCSPSAAPAGLPASEAGTLNQLSEGPFAGRFRLCSADVWSLARQARRSGAHRPGPAQVRSGGLRSAAPDRA